MTSSMTNRIRAAELLLIVALAPAAVAQVPGEAAGGRAALGQRINLQDMRTLHVTRHGQVDQPGGPVGPAACNVVATHTDANFSGGSFVVQAGFAQGEMFAATYTVPAGDWPIKINLTEVIVATSSATQQTVTQWSILYYSGTPQTGTLVDSFSSDGVIIPHIVLPAGTTGVNLQFGVDPNDPEQIIIDAPGDGSNQFTVAFRIDRHNAPPGNPCTQAPPTCCNAFPVTDVSGLQAPTLNWLFGLNCGTFGCPPNGGWARFSNLASFCRPSGDWVSRTTWSSVNCTPGVGACCLPSGICQVLSIQECQAQGGTFQGDGTDCVTTNCPAPRGACCFSNGFCINNFTEAECTGAGGTWAGLNSQCGPNNTCPTGACCLASGECIIVTQAQCAAQGGTFRGANTTCANANCPQPQGACCFPTGFCTILTEADCLGAGATWAGAGTTCVDSNNNGIPDACEADCPADWNGDGQVDFFDYLDFVQDFNDDNADFNHDGQTDFFDYLDFVAAFDEGCE